MNSEMIYLKTRFDPFLFIQNDFLQHIARGIISGIITINVQCATGIKIMISTNPVELNFY